jgi:hypothetical protein
MTAYSLGEETVDSIDLKSLIVSRGVRVGAAVYKEASRLGRIYADPLKCNCLILPDGTIAQLTDLRFHLNYLRQAMSWDSLKQVKYFSQMNTPFSLELDERGEPCLSYRDRIITPVSFPAPTDFFERKTSSGLPFLGNAVIQGKQWLAFQCLWPCEYALSGDPCEFCYSGGVFESLARRGKALPRTPSPEDLAEIVRYAVVESGYCDSIEITGGSTFDSGKESALIRSYLEAIDSKVGREAIKGEILLFITPPEDHGIIDDYFRLGADRIACSVEVWDEKLAETITPGKHRITTRKRHLDALQYAVDTYGPGKAFSNLIIGLEPYDSLMEGAEYLASRGIIPAASIWIPFGRPVGGSMKAPDLDFFRKVKRGFAELYSKFGLEPPGASGVNICIDRDIWKFAKDPMPDA